MTWSMNAVTTAAERGADDDGDRQVDDVASEQELLELVQHVRSPRSEPVVTRPPAGTVTPRAHRHHRVERADRQRRSRRASRPTATRSSRSSAATRRPGTIRWDPTAGRLDPRTSRASTRSSTSPARASATTAGPTPTSATDPREPHQGHRPPERGRSPPTSDRPGRARVRLGGRATTATAATRSSPRRAPRAPASSPRSASTGRRPPRRPRPPAIRVAHIRTGLVLDATAGCSRGWRCPSSSARRPAGLGQAVDELDHARRRDRRDRVPARRTTSPGPVNLTAPEPVDQRRVHQGARAGCCTGRRSCPCPRSRSSSPSGASWPTTCCSRASACSPKRPRRTPGYDASSTRSWSRRAATSVLGRGSAAGHFGCMRTPPSTRMVSAFM